MFNENSDVKILFRTEEENKSINFYVFDSWTSKYDTIYFGYFSTTFYQTFCFFNHAQIVSLNKDFKMKQYELEAGQSIADIQETPIARTSFFHKEIEEAWNNKHHMNLAFIYLFYNEKRSLNNMIAQIKTDYNKALEDKLPDMMPFQEALAHNLTQWLDRAGKASIRTSLEAFKQNPLINYLVSDSHEIIHQKPLKRGHRDSGLYLDISNTINPKFLTAKNVKELVEMLTANSSFDISSKKELSNHISENLFESSDTFHAINAKLINQIELIFELANPKNYSELHKFLTIMINKKTYFHEACFFHESPIKTAFSNVIKFLMKDVSAEKAFRMYNIDPSYVIDHEKDLATIDYEVNTSKYKDAKYLLLQISKRASSKIEEFNLENKNGNYNADLTLLETYNYNGYKLKVIRTFKELFQEGMNLDNCAGANYTLDYYKPNITYVLQKDGISKYMGCLKEGEISQLKGFKNTDTPSKEIFFSILTFLEKNNFVKNRKDLVIKKSTLKKQNTNGLNHDELLYVQECIQWDLDNYDPNDGGEEDE